MDEADSGNATAEIFLKDRLSMRKPEGPTATGVCLHCDEPVEDNRRWCNTSCRDAWSTRNERK